MSLPPITAANTGARALRAANAYAAVDSGAVDSSNADGAVAGTTGGFGEALQQALGNVAAAGHAADAQATAALTGDGNITDVVTALAKAELALQTTMAVRDRVVQAYQDIMRMPI